MLAEQMISYVVTVLFCFILLYCTAQYGAVQYSKVLYCTVLYCAVLCTPCGVGSKTDVTRL